MKRKSLSVAGMSCTNCEQTVENALQQLAGVTRVKANHENHTVEIVVEEDVTTDTLRGIIQNAGYEVPE